MRRSISVLHVDGDREFGDLTATSLERVGEGISVDHVESAAAALEYLETEAVDCVLSDYDVPGDEGLDLLATVRAHYPNLPFILFTGKGTEEVAAQALSAGATDYVQKEADEPAFRLLANRIRNAVVARIATGSFVRGSTATAAGDRLPDGGDARPVSDGNGAPNEASDPEPREVLDGAPDGLVVIDETETIRDANLAVREIFGTDGADVVGASLPELVGDGILEDYRDAVETLAADEAETVHAEFAVTRDGEDRIYEARFAPRPGEAGGVVATVRDVTDQRERVDELQRYETLLRTMPDTVLMTDIEGNMLEFHGFDGWSGYSREELEGANMAEAVPEEHLEKAEAVAIDLFTDDERMKATYEMEIETKDGERIPFENHLRLLPPDDDGKVPGTMSVLRNIEDRKERERQLSRQIERLDQFASIVSHDLRNPLNVAKGHLSFVREHVDDSEHVDTIETALDRMEAIIQDVLTLAREGDEATDLVPVDLAETATNCWENVDTREATLDVETDVTVLADESRLQQLLENLMRNGIDHVGDDIAFRVGALEDGFYVEDDGPGVPEEDREQIFEAGYSTGDGGTGFGLNIVRTIADAHDWEVALAEGSDGGARFAFTGVGFAD